MKLIHAACLCVLVSPSLAAFESTGAGWPNASGNITVVGQATATRAMINPALLVQHSRSLIQFNYFKPYQNIDIHAGSVRSVLIVNGVPLAGSLNYLGDEIYHESQITLGVPIQLDETFFVGLSFNYFQIEVGNNYSRNTVSISPSILYRFSEDIRIGTSMLHLIQVRKSFQVAQRFQTGAVLSLHAATLMMAVEKESALPTEFCFGMTFDLLPFMEIAAGFRDKSQTLSLGWRVHRNPFTAYYYYKHHPVLPVSQGIGLEIYL